MMGSRGRYMVSLALSNIASQEVDGPQETYGVTALQVEPGNAAEPVLLEHPSEGTFLNIGSELGLDFSEINNNLTVETSILEQTESLFSQPSIIEIAGRENIVSTQSAPKHNTDCDMTIDEHISGSEHSLSDVSGDSEDLYQPESNQSSSSEDLEEFAMQSDIPGDEPEPVNPRKRKGQSNCKEWKRQKNSQLRLLGKSYVGFEKNEESGKYRQTSKKEPKTIGPRCGGHSVRTQKGGPKTAFECDIISDEQRSLIFKNFWKKTSWDSKKTFVTENVLPTSPKYRKIASEESRKKQSFRYYFTAKTEDTTKNKIKKQVCKKIFLNTLRIGEKCLQLWTTKVEQRQLSESQKNATLPISKELETWFNTLPKVESHYCRSSSSKLYLEPVFYSFRDMHRLYLEKCASENKRNVSWGTFQNTYKKLNLDIYTPKKDQCNECTLHKNGTLDEECFQKHINKKNDANAEKESDKSFAVENDNIRCYTVDLQAVLLSPRLNASANYYKTKLKIHNQVYYNQATKDVSCYVWHEGAGGLESDVFCTIATKFILKEIGQMVPQKVIIWSDGCPYQNRNVKLSNALLDISMKKNLIIEHKYLEVGHTHMEVDSVHSAIETKLRNRKQIFVPADYISIIESARAKKPYKTFYLSHDDFLQFSIHYYSSIRPGKKAGDPCVNDVVAYQYTPEGLINFKLDFNHAWQPLPTRARVSIAVSERSKLYNGPCPIEESKYQHLQALKLLIPEDYRDFYTNLPFK